MIIIRNTTIIMIMKIIKRIISLLIMTILK